MGLVADVVPVLGSRLAQLLELPVRLLRWWREHGVRRVRTRRGHAPVRVAVRLDHVLTSTFRPTAAAC